MFNDTNQPLPAETAAEAKAFIEAFAKVNVALVRTALTEARVLPDLLSIKGYTLPDWSDAELLDESGLDLVKASEAEKEQLRYLHISVAQSSPGARALFLRLTGLSEKLQKALFPILSNKKLQADRAALSDEVTQLNAWLDWVRQGGFNPASFFEYQRNLRVHGRTQNLSGALGATGAAIAFVDAIREAQASAIVDTVGDIPPVGVRSPQELFDWQSKVGVAPLKALLLSNGRAVVFASSKDANIFQSLGAPFSSAKAALNEFNKLKDNAEERSQVLHEFAVGEIKTATDLSNLHERAGLASRETQTELRTDRFLMMSVLTEGFLKGGRQGRVLNNRDVQRFSHVFNLHHCWGWDGGRATHVEHWNYFVGSVAGWCGLRRVSES